MESEVITALQKIHAKFDYQHDVNCVVNRRMDHHGRWLGSLDFRLVMHLIVDLLLLLFITLTWCYKADAEEVKIQNICANSVGWECYNLSQGATDKERLAVYKKAKKGLRVKPRTVVVLTDPVKTKHGDYQFGASVKGRRLHTAVMPGCFDKSVGWTRDALIYQLSNEYSNFGVSNFYK